MYIHIDININYSTFIRYHFVLTKIINLRIPREVNWGQFSNFNTYFFNEVTDSTEKKNVVILSIFHSIEL